MAEKIYFKEYTPKSRLDERLAKWSKDKGAFENSVYNYETFGLLSFPTILDVLDNYPPIRTEQEFTKIFVAFNEAGKDVGVTVLDHVEEIKGSPYLCVFHLIVRPDEQGKGYGTAMMKKIIEKGDKMMGKPVNEIFTSVDKRNTPSAHTMMKVGLHKELDGEKYNYFSMKLKENGLEK